MDQTVPKDHFGVVIELNLSLTEHPTKIVKCRRYKDIYIDNFKSDISNSNLYIQKCEDVNYTRVLKGLFDKHAPTKYVKNHLLHGIER